ncbi:unnamed protein product [Gadus morhua 'NCC']
MTSPYEANSAKDLRFDTLPIKALRSARGERGEGDRKEPHTGPTISLLFTPHRDGTARGGGPRTHTALTVSGALSGEETRRTDRRTQQDSHRASSRRQTTTGESKRLERERS